MKQLKRLALLVVLAVFVAGCNTMEGLGRDIGKLGDKIERTASEKRNN